MPMSTARAARARSAGGDPRPSRTASGMLPTRAPVASAAAGAVAAPTTTVSTRAARPSRPPRGRSFSISVRWRNSSLAGIFVTSSSAGLPTPASSRGPVARRWELSHALAGRYPAEGPVPVGREALDGEPLEGAAPGALAEAPGLVRDGEQVVHAPDQPVDVGVDP